MLLKISLSWLQLKHKKIRLLVAIAGISFAVVLIFMQLGFQAALFDSAVYIHQSLEGDIFLISPRSTSLIGMKSFSERRLYQTLNFKEIEYVCPIYLGFAQWQNPDNPKYWRNIHIIGFDIRYSIFNLVGVKNNFEQLQRQDVVLFDQASRPEFGEIKTRFKPTQHIVTEIDSIISGTRKVTVVGLFQLGTSFGIDGNLITSHLNFLRIFSHRQPGLIDIGLIKVNSRNDINRVKEKIKNYLPSDVNVFSKQEWINFEKEYWMSSTAIGFIFSLGVGMGLIVGVVVVYQILYTDVFDHLREYATLKALGYHDFYFLSVIFQEAIFLAILGYIPGFLISSILYYLAKNATLLPVMMSHYRAYFVLILTIFMCFISGMMAIRKLKDADPADIF